MKYFKKRSFISLLLVLCLLLSFGAPVTMASSSYSMITYEDESVLKKIDRNVFNSFLLSEVKKMESKLLQSLKNESKYVDGFRVDRLDFNTKTGELTLDFYVHFTKKIDLLITKIKITTHADITAKANLVASNDFKVYGLKDVRFTRVDINNCPDFLDNLAEKLVNKKLSGTFWSGTAPASYKVINEELFKDVINQYIADFIDKPIIEELPYNLGNLEAKFIGTLAEFDLSKGGYAVFNVNIQILLNTGSQRKIYDETISIKIDFFLDTTDNTIVAGINPDITFMAENPDDILQSLLKEAWKNALKEYGRFIKLKF